MSQVFSGDAVTSYTATSVVTTAETPLVTGNFLNPPFQNAKAAVTAMAQLTVGAGTTSVRVRLRRNPNAENFLLVDMNFITVTAGNVVMLTAQAADPIPDGRPVQYSLTVLQNGATGNGTVNLASMQAILISG